MSCRPLLVLPGRCSVDDVASLTTALLPLVRAGVDDVASRPVLGADRRRTGELPVVFVHDPALSSREVAGLRERIESGLPGLPGTDVVVATSGSTGVPRLVGLSARALTLSCLATLEHLGARPSPTLRRGPSHAEGFGGPGLPGGPGTDPTCGLLPTPTGTPVAPIGSALVRTGSGRTGSDSSPSGSPVAAASATAALLTDDITAGDGEAGAGYRQVGAGDGKAGAGDGSLHWVLALPTFHVAGLLVLWRALLQGARPAVVDLAGGFSPALLSACLGALPTATAVVSLVPTQLQRVLESRADSAALSRARTVLVGGASLAPSLAAAAAAASISVTTTYGMTETCGGCVYGSVPLPGTLVYVEPTGPVSAKGPGSRVPLAIAPDSSAPPTTTPAPSATPGAGGSEPGAPAVGAGHDDAVVGRIYLRPPALAEGYLGEAELTEAAFPVVVPVSPGAPGPVPTSPATPPDPTAPSPERWHRTGDLGSWDGHRLRVLGRADDLINTGGEKVAPAAVEEALLATGLVAGACVVGVPDERWGQAVVALVSPSAPTPTAPPLPADQAAALERELVAAARSWPAAWRPKRIVVRPELPLLPGGKMDRAACRELAAAQGRAAPPGATGDGGGQ
ncbi:AMP-binding protein [Buchananella felis]|uniref:AMP-binding protein n=1 Tax=Buchananella felis TaxID=3231492 RepID=UPI0035281BE0